MQKIKARYSSLLSKPGMTVIRGVFMTPVAIKTYLCFTMVMQTLRLWLLGALLAPIVACAPSVTEPAKLVQLQAVGVLPSGTPSKVTGLARFERFSNGITKIRVVLAGLPPKSKRAGYIRVGTCTNPGGIAAKLSEIEARETGDGTGDSEVTTADIPVSAHVAYFQRSEKDAGGVGGPITCGDIK
jgi:hypothetical protein